MDITVAKVGGATFIDTATGVDDCNLGNRDYEPNAPITSTLTVPHNHPNLDQLISATAPELLVDSDAVLEITIDGHRLPRFVLTGAKAHKDGVEIAIADRRWILANRRQLGRVGAPASLTPDFFDPTGLPAGWMLNPGAPGTITVTNAPIDGPFGPADLSAMQIDCDNAGPLNAIVAGQNILAETFDRSVGIGMWVYVPSPLANENLDERILEAVVTNQDTGEALSVIAVNFTTTDRWQLAVAPAAQIPSGVATNVELRVIALPGTFYVSAPVSVITEGLDWDSIDVAEIVRDIVDAANDLTMGHSDTGVRTDSTTAPDCGVVVSRTITNEERKPPLAAISELAASADLFHWITSNDDGTDQLHLDGGNTVTAFELSGSKLVPFVGWQSTRPAGVLGIAAPSNIEITGERAVDWWGPDGGLFTRATEWDYGDEVIVTGPEGDYDPRFVNGLLIHQWEKASRPITFPLTIGARADVIAAVASGDLRVGTVIAVNNGLAWPRGVNGSFRVAKITAKANGGHDFEFNYEPGSGS